MWDFYTAILATFIVSNARGQHHQTVINVDELNPLTLSWNQVSSFSFLLFGSAGLKVGPEVVADAAKMCLQVTELVLDELLGRVRLGGGVEDDTDEAEHKAVQGAGLLAGEEVLVVAQEVGEALQIGKD